MLVRALSLLVVPKDIPRLPHVNIKHLLMEYVREGELLAWVDVLVHLRDGLEVH